MTRLTMGVLLWSVVHMFPAVAPDLRKSVIRRVGENPYKGLFALLMVLAIFLIVSGWKSAPGMEVYVPADWARPVTMLLVLAGFILFLAPYPPNNFRRLLRHPQLTGMLCWGVAHLLSNGDIRSLMLFGGLAAWSLLEIVLLNRRDGSWNRPAAVPMLKDIALVLTGVLAYLVVLYTHHLLIGGAPLR